jgi:LAO/AO transport system kinase
MVIDAPGLGDEIQSIKAGILEIADILVVNKADRPGVDATERALQSMLQLAHPARHEFRHHGRLETVETSTPTSQSELWLPPVLRTVATEGTGISELVEAISRHQQYLARSGERLQRDQSRLQTEMELLLHGSLIARWRQSIEDEAYNKVVNELVERRLSPHQAVQMLLNGDSL